MELAKELPTSVHFAFLHAATLLAVLFKDLGLCTSFVLVLVSCAVFLALLVLPVVARTTKSSSVSSSSSSTASAASPFSISIVDVRVNGDGKVEYLLKGSYKAFVWTSWKRYSSLRKLKPFLKLAFPKKSPFKKYVTGSEMDLKFVSKRRAELSTVLTEGVSQDFFENGIPDDVREEALGVPADSITIDKARLSKEEVVKEILVGLDLASKCLAVAEAGGGDGWSEYGKNRDGSVCGYIKEEGSLTFAMGRGTVRGFSKEQVLAFLTNDAYRAEWDENFKFEVILETYDTSGGGGDEVQGGFGISHLNVVRTATSSPAKQFVAERDSVCATVSARRIADGALFHCFRSVVHSKAPVGMDKYIRAKVMCAAFVVQDDPVAGGCMLTSVAMFDPVGNIPKWVINLALKNNTWQPWTRINSRGSLD